MATNPFGRPAMVAGQMSAPNGGVSTPSQATGSLRSPVNFSAARSDITDAMAGRVTLAMLDLIILALIGFYIATKSAQGSS